MPSLRMQSPLAPRTSVNPLFRHSDAPFTSFDASHFQFRQQKIADRRKAHLRRYHSHESQNNYIESSGESKDPSPDNTQNRSEGPPSKSSKSSSSTHNSTNSDSITNDNHCSYEVREFLDRFSLPRVVRVTSGGAGEPLLLYRCFDNFTKVQARPVGRKGKEKHDGRVLQFPEGYPGWFSLTTDKGDRCALLHTSLLHLVREQVCSFLSCASFTAYTAHTSEAPAPGGDGLTPPRPGGLVSTQYVRTVVRPGQVFRLRAVFQHRERDNAGRHSTRSGRLGSRTARDKDLANRYAQLIDVNNQELYAPLTTKGEFYEVHSSTKARLCFPGMLDKTGPLALDKDCLYRLAHLMRRVHLPLKVKLMSGPLPHGLPKDFPDTFILEAKFQEPLLVTCTLPAPGETLGHQINCLNINSKLKLARSMLGFDSEYKLFKSQRLQSALSHCHKNVEQWYRQVRLVPNIKNEQKQTSVKEDAASSDNICPGCRKMKKLCGGKCDYSGEEMRRYTETNVEKQLITKEVLEKFPKPKKWYRHFKLLGNNDSGSEKFCRDPTLEGAEKLKSIDRYKDMSKLIEEKFGKKNSNPVKKSASFMFSSKRIDLEETSTKGDPSRLKCQSLDTQLYVAENSSHHKPRVTRKRGSDVSESFSHEFQMCILENEKGLIDNNTKLQRHSLRDLRSLNMVITEIDFDQIKPEAESTPAKPDLIPFTQNDHSFITERLCSEFHVKTKIQKKSNNNIKITKTVTIPDTQKPELKEVHVVQVHQATKVQSRALPVVDDLPYSNVVDEVRRPSTRNVSEPENVYAEICDDKPARRTDTEYCYVKLGSNGDSITQSSDDDLEAIYNTLR